MSLPSQPANLLSPSFLREFPRTATYLVGVSGGCDSMLLWMALRAEGYQQLTVCHVNHQLRGADADADQDFVMARAAQLETPAVSVRLAVREEAQKRRQSIELVARDMRYEWFFQQAQALDCPRLLLAHHADDQVETVLMNFFRGAGSAGLSGMAERSVKHRDGVELEILRPLLGVERQRIEAVASAAGILWREDASNREPFALRNRVRHRLMPVLDEVFPRDVRAAVIRSAAITAADEAWMATMEGELPRRDDGGGLCVKALRRMPPAQRRRLLLRWLREESVPRCGFEEVCRVEALTLGESAPAKVNLPGGRYARRRSGVLFLE